jgi:hypothetical protein
MIGWVPATRAFCYIRYLPTYPMYSVVNLRGRERAILSWCKRLWGVETGTKAVISANFSAYGERTVNNLRANFSYWNTLKRVFQQPRLLTPTIQPKQPSLASLTAPSVDRVGQ